MINTITGIAEGLLGNVEDWRKVVANNPAELFGKLSPSLNADIVGYYSKVKNITGQLNITGLDNLEKDGQLVLQKLLGNRLDAVGTKVESLKPTITKGVELLKQLDWLL